MEEYLLDTIEESKNLIIYNRREYESNAMESVQSRVKINKQTEYVEQNRWHQFNHNSNSHFKHIDNIRFDYSRYR